MESGSVPAFAFSPFYRLTLFTDRVYDDFWTQTPVGMAEFSDQPLPPIPEVDQYYGFFPARYVAEYLESYIESHVYAGTTLSSRIRTKSRVMKLNKDPNDEQWHVHICEHTGKQHEVTAPRIIDATGLTSSPNIPSIPGLDEFAGKKVHQMDVAQSDILANDKEHHVVVIGGAKSAADLAYASAKAGKHVFWVIRKNGSGPASFASARGSGPYKNSNESVYTRLTALFLASIFTDTSRSGRSFAGCVEWMLYRTSIGIAIFGWIWERITARAWKEAGYTTRQLSIANETSSDKNDPRGTGFHHLQPDTSIFWQNDSSGINQRPDFFSTIAEKVAVYRADIDRVKHNVVYLADQHSTRLPADVILLATGWNTQNSFAHIDEATASTLGLPIPKSSLTQDYTTIWAPLDSHASTRILARFPILTHPPPHHTTRTPLSPFRLYKSMLPIADPSIIFLGKVTLGNHFRAAEVQALWALAVFDGTLKLPANELMRVDVAQTVEWCRRRYLGKGQAGNWFWFDMVGYTDELVGEIGLGGHRGGKGWCGMGEWVKPCLAGDLRGLVGEYRERYAE